MDINYKIEDKIGIISQRETGWLKELNIVNWNDKGGKFDIREWSPEHDKMNPKPLGIPRFQTADKVFRTYNPEGFFYY